MEKIEKIFVVSLASVLFLSGMIGVLANGGNGGEPGGCTPGYWKNHQDAWIPTGINPSDEVGDWFIVTYPDLANTSLLDALSFKKGRNLEGAARILLRTSVAALLNDAHPDIDRLERLEDFAEVIAHRSSPDVLLRRAGVSKRTDLPRSRIGALLADRNRLRHPRGGPMAYPRRMRL